MIEQKIARGMEAIAKIARLYKKHGHPPTFIPIPRSDEVIPRYVRRKLPGKSVEQIQAVTAACALCRLPKNAMKVGGIVQKCHCKPAKKVSA